MAPAQSPVFTSGLPVIRRTITTAPLSRTFRYTSSSSCSSSSSSSLRSLRQSIDTLSQRLRNLQASNDGSSSNSRTIEDLRKQIDSLQSNGQKFQNRVDREFYGKKGKRAEDYPGLISRVEKLEDKAGIESPNPTKKRGGRSKTKNQATTAKSNKKEIEKNRKEIAELRDEIKEAQNELPKKIAAGIENAMRSTAFAKAIADGIAIHEAKPEA